MSVLQAQQDETQRALDAAAEDLRTKTAEMAKIEAELRPMQEKLAEQQRIAAEHSVGNGVFLMIVEFYIRSHHRERKSRAVELTGTDRVE